MTETFADTSFFVAVLNPRDAHHDAGRRFLASPRVRIVTTAWVLSEVGNYFSRSANRVLFVELVDAVADDPWITVLPADDATFRLGFDLYAARPDKDWSFVDCVSFAVMERRGIADALSADRHFEQAGFRTLLK